MAYPKQYPEKPLVALRAFAQERDMLELPFCDVLEAFEEELEPCSVLGYSRDMCYDTILYNVVTDSKENWGGTFDLAKRVFCKTYHSHPEDSFKAWKRDLEDRKHLYGL